MCRRNSCGQVNHILDDRYVIPIVLLPIKKLTVFVITQLGSVMRVFELSLVFKFSIQHFRIVILIHYKLLSKADVEIKKIC